MDIAAVIDYLNKEYGYDLNSSYYLNISFWQDWWRGYREKFHKFTETGPTGQKITRKLYSLKMAKKVSEDWASILLNEKTTIGLKDKKSSEFIDSVLSDNKFVKKGNRLIEKTFALGTGAFVLRLENLNVKSNGAVLRNADTKIKIEYLSANHIIPLSVQYGEITEVAFVSDVLQAGKKLIYLEIHRIEYGQYVIRNKYFKLEEGALKEQPLPNGILEELRTGGNVPMFSIVTPNTENNIDSSNALGMSIFADAIDVLEGVDLAYNNFNRDFKLGGKKVFMNQSLVKRLSDGTTITPDDVSQQLFVQTGDDLLDPMNGTKTLIQEHNPTLRVDENVKGVQAQLDLLSFKCGLGSKYYRFDSSGNGKVMTATEYNGDRQDLVKNTNKHLLNVTDALTSLIRAILWVGKELQGAQVNPDDKITIDFDDTYISDKASERLQDIQDVRDGIMQKYEYRMKWYGEDEETAKSKVTDSSSGDVFGFGTE